MYNILGPGQGLLWRGLGRVFGRGIHGPSSYRCRAIGRTRSDTSHGSKTVQSLLFAYGTSSSCLFARTGDGPSRRAFFSRTGTWTYHGSATRCERRYGRRRHDHFPDTKFWCYYSPVSCGTGPTVRVSSSFLRRSSKGLEILVRNPSPPVSTIKTETVNEITHWTPESKN